MGKRCRCGNIKDTRAKQCKYCYNESLLETSLSATLKDSTYKTTRKWSLVRKIGHKVMKKHRVPKKCAICGFTLVVELCHKKPIKDFKPTSLLSEINSLDNLIYLCPNHHKMLDKNLL